MNYLIHITVFLKRSLAKIVKVLRGAWLSQFIDEGGGRISLSGLPIPVVIRKDFKARLIVRGVLNIRPFLGGNKPAFIWLAEGATLEINGDFIIGDGVSIWVDKNATLIIGGRNAVPSSGITADSKIMVKKNIRIGTDFMCAWGITITDSDWHEQEGRPWQSDVMIGDHVWIAHNSSVLKGSTIPDGCIVASYSMVSGGVFGSNSLLAGIPAKSKRTGVKWSR